MLELQGVCSGYGRLRVLFDVDLSVDAGEFVAVVGNNGAGKSTLLKTILGIVPVTGGQIRVAGKRVTHLPAHERFARGVSLSPEGRRIFPRLTVLENLHSGAFGQAGDVTAQQVDMAFTLFPRLQERSSQRAGSLSGGEQQMLAVSRALMSRPRLLMVDELSMGLAPLIVEELLDALRQLSTSGLTVIVVDQFARTLLDYAARGYLMEKGRIEFQGDAEALRSRVDAGASVGVR